MTTLNQAVLALLAIGAAVALARIGFLLIARRPVLALTVSDSISEEERLKNAARYRFDRISGDLFLNDDSPLDEHHLRVKYVVGGREYRETVRVLLRTGDRASPWPIVWYDPADPSRVTADGLGMPLLALALAGGTAAWVLGWL